MNIQTSVIKFLPGFTLNQEHIQKTLFELTGLNGITSLKVEPDLVKIEYYQHLLSTEMIQDALGKAGFPFKHQNDKPGIFHKFIAKLGQDNKKAFGGHPPDCCGK